MLKGSSQNYSFSAKNLILVSGTKSNIIAFSAILLLVSLIYFFDKRKIDEINFALHRILLYIFYVFILPILSVIAIYLQFYFIKFFVLLIQGDLGSFKIYFIVSVFIAIIINKQIGHFLFLGVIVLPIITLVALGDLFFGSEKDEYPALLSAINFLIHRSVKKNLTYMLNSDNVNRAKKILGQWIENFMFFIPVLLSVIFFLFISLIIFLANKKSLLFSYFNIGNKLLIKKHFFDILFITITFILMFVVYFFVFDLTMKSNLKENMGISYMNVKLTNSVVSDVYDSKKKNIGALVDILKLCAILIFLVQIYFFSRCIQILGSAVFVTLILLEISVIIRMINENNLSDNTIQSFMRLEVGSDTKNISINKAVSRIYACLNISYGKEPLIMHTVVSRKCKQQLNEISSFFDKLTSVSGAQSKALLELKERIEKDPSAKKITIGDFSLEFEDSVIFPFANLYFGSEIHSKEKDENSSWLQERLLSKDIVKKLKRKLGKKNMRTITNEVNEDEEKSEEEKGILKILIAGPSGSGKTSLLASVLGLVDSLGFEQIEDQILNMGIEQPSIVDLQSSEKGTILLIEQDTVSMNYNGEVKELFPQLEDFTEKESAEIVKRIFTELKLSLDILNRPVSTCSGGEKSRILMAVKLYERIERSSTVGDGPLEICLKNWICIVDEAFDSLSPTARAGVLSFLQKYSKSKISFIMVSHASWAPDIVFFIYNKILFIITAEEYNQILALQQKAIDSTSIGQGMNIDNIKDEIG